MAMVGRRGFLGLIGGVSVTAAAAATTAPLWRQPFDTGHLPNFDPTQSCVQERALMVFGGTFSRYQHALTLLTQEQFGAVLMSETALVFGKQTLAQLRERNPLLEQLSVLPDAPTTAAEIKAAFDWIEGYNDLMGILPDDEAPIRELVLLSDRWHLPRILVMAKHLNRLGLTLSVVYPEVSFPEPPWERTKLFATRLGIWDLGRPIPQI